MYLGNSKQIEKLATFIVAPKDGYSFSVLSYRVTHPEKKGNFFISNSKGDYICVNINTMERIKDSLDLLCKKYENKESKKSTWLQVEPDIKLSGLYASNHKSNGVEEFNVISLIRKSIVMPLLVVSLTKDSKEEIAIKFKEVISWIDNCLKHTVDEATELYSKTSAISTFDKTKITLIGISRNGDNVIAGSCNNRGTVSIFSSTSKLSHFSTRMTADDVERLSHFIGSAIKSLDGEKAIRSTGNFKEDNGYAVIRKPNKVDLIELKINCDQFLSYSAVTMYCEPEIILSLVDYLKSLLPSLSKE